MLGFRMSKSMEDRFIFESTPNGCFCYFCDKDTITITELVALLKEDKGRNIFDFIRNNFGDHKEAIIKGKFQEIELMDGINGKCLEAFALSLGKTMDSEEYCTT
uniref:DUF674 family protein n=1 Tax=Parastrongyloides trichosuri TaxID=131310 RepID=A0A0N5A449_PARTI